MKVWLPAIRGGSGSDVWTGRLADALMRRGIEAEVTWFSGHYQFCPLLLQSVNPPPKTNIIHANSWNAFAFKRPGIPLVVTEHLNVLDPLYGPYKSPVRSLYHSTLIRRYMTASFRAASAVVTVSHCTASGLAGTLGLDSVQVIYNWVDTHDFSPLEEKTRPSQRAFRLLFVGNLSRRKGADLLAPVMRNLGQGFELRFTSGLRALNVKHRTENMRPLGRLTRDSDLIEAYRTCDALLFPSRFEGLPLAPLEAMACGKPVVAARASSLPEVVEDRVCGILCPPDDIEAFARACRKLAAEPETLRAYSHAARYRAETLFSEEAVVPKYIGLYRRLLEAR